MSPSALWHSPTLVISFRCESLISHQHPLLNCKLQRVQIRAAFHVPRAFSLSRARRHLELRIEESKKSNLDAQPLGLRLGIGKDNPIANPGSTQLLPHANQLDQSKAPIRSVNQSSMLLSTPDSPPLSEYVYVLDDIKTGVHYLATTYI